MKSQKSKSFNRIRDIKSQPKAQAAMEFLMTYGWAILAVAVVIGVLDYTGILGGATLLPERCTIDPGSGLFCEDFVAYPGRVILRVRNILTSPVNITGASVSQGRNSCNLPSSASIYLKGENVGELSLFDGSTCLNLTLPGKKLKGDISITYIRQSLSRTAKGDTVVRVGESAPGEADHDICDTAAHPPNDPDQDLCNELDWLFEQGGYITFNSEDCCSTFNLCC